MKQAMNKEGNMEANKWEDTVMTGEEMSQEIQRKAKKWSIVNPKFIEDIAHITANKQAEITWPVAFKAGKDKGKQEGIKEVVEPSDELLEIGRKAIEDTLVEWRDGRLSEFNRGNGLIIREKDGKDSSIIRFGSETALRIGLKAMGQAFLKKRVK